MRNIDDITILQVFVESQGPVGATTICSILNESQTTIGRRLKDLEDKGFLKKIGNRGRVITSKGIDAIERRNRLIAFEEKAKEYSSMLGESAEKNINECIEIRLVLEVLAAKLACKHITKDQIEKMEELLIQFANALRDGGDTKEIDLSFHLLLAQASGNNYLFLQLKDVLTINNSYFAFYILAKDLGDHTVGLLQHTAILDAIKEGNEEKAEIAVERHIEKIKCDINEYFQNRDRLKK